MPKTHDEIKKGLKHCSSKSPCCSCPMWDECKEEGSLKRLFDNALALIHQLEAELEDMTARYKIADDCAKKKGEMNEKLYAEVTAVKAERDALMADFKLYRERNIKHECGVYACDLCKLGGNYDEWEECKCPKGCMGIKNWQWRGVQKED